MLVFRFDFEIDQALFGCPAEVKFEEFEISELVTQALDRLLKLDPEMDLARCDCVASEQLLRFGQGHDATYFARLSIQ